MSAETNQMEQMGEGVEGEDDVQDNGGEEEGSQEEEMEEFGDGLEMSEQDQVNISTKMFYGGFALLPFLWLVNVWYFRHVLFALRLPGRVNGALKRNIVGSLVGFLVTSVLFFTWLGVYLDNREAWGVTGDMLSVNIPKGD
eukprot:TRINITY_DN2423_c0_g1_i5.p1 TRINITY_DN2423_c0_g1~~TRINITY_DN2423_c0_g1_i5.p1  ORF type:complete len:159 (-),score=40.88 TRINITY_DN2423_c0_g1_i5:344-766(-)